VVFYGNNRINKTRRVGLSTIAQSALVTPLNITLVPTRKTTGEEITDGLSNGSQWINHRVSQQKRVAPLDDSDTKNQNTHHRTWPSNETDVVPVHYQADHHQGLSQLHQP